jgi:hypothetical protein
MPRIGMDVYPINVTDELSGDPILFQMRMPGAKMRNKYNNKSIVRRGRKTEFNAALARVEYGMKLLVGIREGDFLIPPKEHENYENLQDSLTSVEDSDLKFLNIASDQSSPFYTSQWKEHVEKYGNDLIEAAASKLFDNPASVEDQNVDVEDDEEDIEKN